jgi:hypothetical protein
MVGERGVGDGIKVKILDKSNKRYWMLDNGRKTQ